MQVRYLSGSGHASGSGAHPAVTAAVAAITVVDILAITAGPDPLPLCTPCGSGHEEQTGVWTR